MHSKNADNHWTRRKFLTATAAVLPAAHLATTARAADSPKAVGPILGHVDHQRAMIWYRPTAPDKYVAELIDKDGKSLGKKTATASPENDLCVSWSFDGLSPDATYLYEIHRGDKSLVAGSQFRLHTAPAIDKAARTTLAFGSCASSTDFFDIWKRIGQEGAQGLVLLGDTPYINSSNLKVNRDHHRKFLSIPTLTKLCTDIPLWGTWDDHDFGGNDTDGKVKGKATIRKAFTEYRTHVNYGDEREGVYTKFRRGPIEVFLIDARYFAQTGPSPVDPKKPTGLGPGQWKWLLSSLKASTAPFKVLASGMIWDDKQNGEKDDWHTYAHEREALFDFIGREKITGVVLIAGDIHVSRHLKYPTRDRIGYDLHQFISSPMHNSIIPSLNKPNSALVWGKAVPNTFLRMVGDSTKSVATLTAEWIDIKGRRLHTAQLKG
jgi:alkaline phosphatase D